MKAVALLRLYPRRWRERYGDELADLLGDRPLTVRGFFDLISGAVDAHVTTGETMPKFLESACRPQGAKHDIADGLRAAAAMIGGTLLMSGLGILASRGGWHEVADGLKSLAFPLSLVIMSDMLYLRNQSRVARWLISGGTTVMLVLITLVATRL